MEPQKACLEYSVLAACLTATEASLGHVELAFPVSAFHGYCAWRTWRTEQHAGVKRRGDLATQRFPAPVSIRGRRQLLERIDPERRRLNILVQRRCIMIHSLQPYYSAFDRALLVSSAFHYCSNAVY